MSHHALTPEMKVIATQRCLTAGKKMQQISSDDFHQQSDHTNIYSAFIVPPPPPFPLTLDCNT